MCAGLFVDASAADRFTRIYQGFIKARLDFDAMGRTNKHLIMKRALAGELHVLATQLARIARGGLHTCDFTFNSQRSALAQVVANFPVYRTYVAGCESAAEDVRYVNWAVGVAKKRSRDPDPSIFDFIQDVLLAREARGKGEAYENAVCAFAMKFQQYHRPGHGQGDGGHDLLSIQPAGVAERSRQRAAPVRRLGPGIPQGQPGARRALAPCPAVHLQPRQQALGRRARAHQRALRNTRRWNLVLARWRKLNRRNRRKLDGIAAPSRNDEYLLYQTLLGIWPFDRSPTKRHLAQLRERVAAYMLKAGREAKVHSSLDQPGQRV